MDSLYQIRARKGQQIVAARQVDGVLGEGCAPKIGLIKVVVLDHRPHRSVDDGDTVMIAWPSGDKERIRILGIDTPETAHPEHNLPIAQRFGEEATTFAQGAFSAATRIELLRSAELDPFGRTLGYIFLNGQNYSLMVLGAKLAVENVSRFGDNGFPKEAAKIERLAKKVGPMPFENPSDFRKRMRKYSKWLNRQGRHNTH